MAVAILTYSSLVYFAEKEVPEGIANFHVILSMQPGPVRELYAVKNAECIYLLSHLGINCTNWGVNASNEHWSTVINHPCYVWTFVESFW